MTKDAGAGSYKVPYRWRPMTFKVDGQEYTNERHRYATDRFCNRSADA